jgi:hypothetical protein
MLRQMNEYTITVKIPIRSYLKKFIAGSNNVEPFKVSIKRCHFSAIILEPLQKEKVIVKEVAKIRWNDELICAFDTDSLKEKKFWISIEAMNSIDFRLKSLFDQSLIDFININHKRGTTIEENILKFLNYYQISEDDLSVETAQKMYYRARYPQHVISSKKRKEVIDSQPKLFDY